MIREERQKFNFSVGYHKTFDVVTELYIINLIFHFHRYK